MDLDSTTLHVCNAVMNATYGAMFLGAWAVQRGERHFLFWAASLLLNALCVLGFAYIPRSNPWTISLLFFGIVANIQLLWMGMRSFDGRRPFKPSLVVLPLFSFPLHLLAFQTLPRNVAAASALAILAVTVGAAGLYVLRHGEDRQSFARRATGLALFAYIPVYVVSAFEALFQSYDNAVLVLLADQVLSSIFVVALFSVTLKRSRTALEQQALQDGLTGALNRIGLERQLGRRDAASRRAVLVADLDHFKSINDRFGHAAGDEVLQRFALLARHLLGPTDLLARTGGEEFVLVLGAGDERRVAKLAEELRQLFADTPTVWRDSAIRATVSIGLSDFAPGASFAEALEAADQALYRAKQTGRNRVMRADANSFPVFA